MLPPPDQFAARFLDCSASPLALALQAETGSRRPFSLIYLPPVGAFFSRRASRRTTCFFCPPGLYLHHLRCVTHVMDSLVSRGTGTTTTQGPEDVAAALAAHRAAARNAGGAGRSHH